MSALTVQALAGMAAGTLFAGALSALLAALKSARAHPGSPFGFAAEAGGEMTTAAELTELLHQVTPDDLMEFGMIPEFVGRLPMIATLGPLDEEALMQVLTEPRNSVCRQYQKLFDLSGSELEFTPAGLRDQWTDELAARLSLPTG